MQKRSSIIAGLILIIVGAFFLLAQAFPGLASIFNPSFYWPFIIVVVGGLFLLVAFLGTPPLAVPGSRKAEKAGPSGSAESKRLLDGRHVSHPLSNASDRAAKSSHQTSWVPLEFLDGPGSLLPMNLRTER